ncbi:MAG: TolC family outer membrane protein [Gammaproteobacteria bacterium]
MKKYLTKMLLIIGMTCTAIAAHAVDLIGVYVDALQHDPTFLAAKTTYMSALEELPINLASLLPQLNIIPGSNGSLYVNRTDNTGDLSLNDTFSQHGYGFALDLSQTVFNWGQFMLLAQANATVKEAAATFYSAQQDLMVRTADAYFQVLENLDNVKYTSANVEANKRSLDQAEQQYHVGLKTLTDVYTSKAAFSSAVSDNVTAKNNVENAEENLRAITGKTYKTYAPLSKSFPLIPPQPSNIDRWVDIALQHNWDLAAQHYNALAEKRQIQVQFAGHLPQVDIEGDLSQQYDNSMGDTLGVTRGNSRIKGAEARLNVTVPIFAGGGVMASTRQAEYNYRTAMHNYELQRRTTINNTRQDYLGIVAGISKVKADASAIQSNEQALEGLDAGYKVGTQTIIDVLNQQALLLQAQQTYAADRYQYINDIIALKNDTGTLSVEDLMAINEWLGKAPAKNYKDKASRYKAHTLNERFDGMTPVPPHMIPVGHMVPVPCANLNLPPKTIQMTKLKAAPPCKKGCAHSADKATSAPVATTSSSKTTTTKQQPATKKLKSPAAPQKLKPSATKFEKTPVKTASKTTTSTKTTDKKKTT